MTSKLFLLRSHISRLNSSWMTSEIEGGLIDQPENTIIIRCFYSLVHHYFLSGGQNFNRTALTHFWSIKHVRREENKIELMVVQSASNTSAKLTPFVCIHDSEDLCCYYVMCFFTLISWLLCSSSFLWLVCSWFIVMWVVWGAPRGECTKTFYEMQIKADLLEIEFF